MKLLLLALVAALVACEPIPRLPEYLVCDDGFTAGPHRAVFLGEESAEGIDSLNGSFRTVFTRQIPDGVSCRVTTEDPNAPFNTTTFNN